MLAELERTIAPLCLAGVRRLAVPGELSERLPVGGIQRGSVLTIGGVAGSGVTTAAFSLAAAATMVGEWAAVVDPGSLGGAAAAECGVALERCAVVRGVEDARWSVVVGALLEGFAVVIAAAPLRLTLGDAQRLLARARERRAILVVLEAVPGMQVGVWPAPTAIRVKVAARQRQGLTRDGGGLLAASSLSVHVEGKGVPQTSSLALARAG